MVVVVVDVLGDRGTVLALGQRCGQVYMLRRSGSEGDTIRDFTDGS